MEVIATVYAFVVAHSAEILGIWVILEQILAANTKIKSNSTFQLLSEGAKTLLSRTKK